MPTDDPIQSPKKFDELDYTTWFKSDEIRRNLCTFVPFVTTKYEPFLKTTATTTSYPEPDTLDRLNLTEADQVDTNKPPLKKMCIDSKLSPPLDIDTDTAVKINARTGEKYYLKKTKVFESILSLLVKIFYRNQVEILEKAAVSSNVNPFVEFDFLKSKQTNVAASRFNRIGDENDFVYNLLETASNACDKCRINIETSLESLNNMNKKNAGESLSLDLGMVSGVTGESVSPQTSAGVDDEVKNKKIKARARQQKLLAQMTSNQQAFLQNPSNKVDIEGYRPDLTVVAGDVEMACDEDAGIEATSAGVDTAEVRSVVVEEEQYDCCICRLTSSSDSDRPIGAVTLLQATSGKLFFFNNRSNKRILKNVFNVRILFTKKK